MPTEPTLNIRRIDTRQANVQRELAELRDRLSPRGNVVSEAGRRRTIEVFGEPHGCRMFRKVAPWYAKRFGPANEFNKRVVLMSSKAEFHDLLDRYLLWRRQFLDETGQLKPNYRPPPMVASFMEEPASVRREHIPVPKGPVEVW